MQSGNENMENQLDDFILRQHQIPINNLKDIAYW